MRIEKMETIKITLPPALAARARSLAATRRQKLPDFIQAELHRALIKKNGGRIARGSQLKSKNDLQELPDHEVM